jgi:Na+/H+ antiporter NhaC
MKRFAWLIGAVVFIGICLAAYGNRPIDYDPSKVGAWYSIIPALLAVVLAFVTHNVFIALVGAVVTGSFLIHLPAGIGDLNNWTSSVLKLYEIPKGILTDNWYLQTLAFIVLVLSLISVVIVGGGLKAVIDWLSTLAKGRSSTQLITYILGLLIFIDDYANTMLVGSSMRPLSDHHRISREKLAFLVDTTSAPVAGIAFISTWVGYEIGLFRDVSEALSLGVDGYSMFFDALSFRFYCFLMLIYGFINVISKKDFGPMAAAELRAQKTGQVMRPTGTEMKSKSYAHEVPDASCTPRVRTAFIPIAFMFLYLFGGLWVDGGGLALMANDMFAVFSITNWRDVIAGSENNIRVLYEAAGIGLILALIAGLLFSGVKAKYLFLAAARGFKSSLLPMLILILAWSIKAVCDQLMTGPFLVASIGEYMSPIWFPVAIFVLAAITAFSTGTSWGTMAILIPVAIPLAHQLDGETYGLVTMISLGAILDGAIFGDHCSPISDTTIMSSISSGCDHMDHVKTQLPYSLMVGLVAMIFGYFSAANEISSFVGILAGSLVILILHLILVRVWIPKSSS